MLVAQLEANRDGITSRKALYIHGRLECVLEMGTRVTLAEEFWLVRRTLVSVASSVGCLTRERLPFLTYGLGSCVDLGRVLTGHRHSCSSTRSIGSQAGAGNGLVPDNR